VNTEERFFVPDWFPSLKTAVSLRILPEKSLKPEKPHKYGGGMIDIENTKVIFRPRTSNQPREEHLTDELRSSSAERANDTEPGIEARHSHRRTFMFNHKSRLKRFLMLTGLCLMTVSSSGCQVSLGFVEVMWEGMTFWGTTPFIPVPAYWSQAIEDGYHEEERYGRVPVLNPVEGEHAPLFCIDPPSDDEVMRALPDNVTGGIPFIAETSRNNVRIVVEPIVDKLEDCRFYPMVGPARLHKCHYKCTVYFDETKRSDWPVPFSHTDQRQEVVYVDHDHLIRCAGPASE